MNYLNKKYRETFNDELVRALNETVALPATPSNFLSKLWLNLKFTMCSEKHLLKDKKNEFTYKLIEKMASIDNPFIKEAMFNHFLYEDNLFKFINKMYLKRNKENSATFNEVMEGLGYVIELQELEERRKNPRRK